MKNSICVLIAVIVALVLPSCHKVSGSGPVISQTYNHSGFFAVNIGISGDVYYTQDSVYKVEVHAQSNILDNIETKVVDGELMVQFEKFKYIGKHDRVTLYISCPNINKITVNGSSNIMALQPISGTNLDLKISGSGNMTIAGYTGVSLSADVNGSGDIQVNGGKVNNEYLKISGSGNLNLFGIEAAEVTTHTSGSGDISVNATNKLNAHISGSGNVTYTGYPAVYTSISGSGKVRHL